MMKTSAKQMQLLQVLHYLTKFVVLFYLITSVKSVDDHHLRIRRSSADSSAECIRYELHEPFGNGSKVDSVMRNCQSHSGYLDKLTRFTINKRTSMVNVTFECCVGESFSCQSDLDCPFNFNCDVTRKECTVAECILTDDLDSVSNEGSACIFDEDCLFFVPQDTKSWGCIATCNTSPHPHRLEDRINRPRNKRTRIRGRRSISLPNSNSNFNSNDLQCITRQCKRCPSTPRVIFNATTDFNDLVEVFVDNSLESTSSSSSSSSPSHSHRTNLTKDQIPPLAILLNSTAFAPDPTPTHYYWRRQTLNTSDISGNSHPRTNTSNNSSSGGEFESSSSSSSHSTSTTSTPSPDETRRNIADEETSDEVLASILTSTNVSNVVTRETGSLLRDPLVTSDILSPPTNSTTTATNTTATNSTSSAITDTSTLTVANTTRNKTDSTNSLDNGTTNVNSTIHTLASVAAITLTTSTTTTSTEAPVRAATTSSSSSSTTTAAATINSTISTTSTSTTTSTTSTTVAPNESGEGDVTN